MSVLLVEDNQTDVFVIREALGAFPTLELAEGEYDVIARNNGQEFKDKVKVVSGVNRDHEVVMR